MKILAVDSSSKTTSVAILEDKKVVSEYFLDIGLTHSQTLAPMVNCLLKNSKISPKEIDLFAVTNGPGSFTGLRIGIAIIKGMATVLNKPCTSVSSLYSTIFNYIEKNGVFYVCTDYRNGQLYNAVFEINNRKIIYFIKDRAIDIQTLNKELKNKDIFLVGNSAEICYENLHEKSENFRLLPEVSSYVKASNIGLIALKQYKNKEFLNAQNLNPVYLRVSQAERQHSER